GVEGRRPGARRRRRRRRRVSPADPGPETREALAAFSTVAEPAPQRTRRRPTWGLEEGDAIAPGRTVLRGLGGGRRYEVFIVWEDHRLAVLVAKVLRPEH